MAKAFSGDDGKVELVTVTITTGSVGQSIFHHGIIKSTVTRCSKYPYKQIDFQPLRHASAWLSFRFPFAQSLF